ncbi:MAG: four helix bundle protein [Limisphaerales bacterium]
MKTCRCGRRRRALYNRVLDLLEEPRVPLTPGFRNQLDRAALSISNNIAEGFERVTTNELNHVSPPSHAAAPARCVP